MQLLYELIKEEPEFFAWAFGLINVLWGIFIYFNKKRHSRELVKLKQSLDLDLERRRKVFEMKASQYEAYFNHIDSFQRKHQNDFQEIFTPLFNEFMARSLQADSVGDEEESTNAIVWFNEEITKITINGFQEFMVLESETNSLKLTASDEVARLLGELTKLQHDTFELSSELMKNMVEITMSNNQAMSDSYNEKLMSLGNRAKEKAQELRDEMRRDLGDI